MYKQVAEAVAFSPHSLLFSSKSTKYTTCVDVALHEPTHNLTTHIVNGVFIIMELFKVAMVAVGVIILVMHHSLASRRTATAHHCNLLQLKLQAFKI